MPVTKFISIEEMCRLYRKQMGRGRKGAMTQRNKKENKMWKISEKDKQVFVLGATKGKQKVVVMPEDVLNELRQIDPRVLANILAGM